jgi:hypothetical protein
MDPWCAIRAAACLVNRRNPPPERSIGPRSRRRLALAPGPGAAGGDTQHAAQDDDGVVGLLAIDELIADYRVELVSCASGEEGRGFLQDLALLA